MLLGRRKWQATFAFVVAVAGSVRAQAQTTLLRIEPETGQTQFRVGEAIRLNLAFESSSVNGRIDNWMVTITGRDRSVLGLGSDRFVASPDAGTTDPWSYRVGEGIAYSGPGGMYLREKITLAQLDLYQWVRFERPGHYRVRALFHMHGPQQQNVALESNEIDIEIVAADVAWQDEQLREAVGILNSVPEKPDNQTF